MVAQITISKSFQDKMTKIDQLYGDAIEEKLVSLGHYAVAISPVQTGAFVESWSLRPVGSSSGRSRTSANKPLKDNEAAKGDARDNIVEDAARFKEEIKRDGGALLINRSPHAQAVDDKYLTITRTRDRFR